MRWWTSSSAAMAPDSVLVEIVFKNHNAHSMRRILFAFTFQLLAVVVFSQATPATHAEPDTARLKSEIMDLENVRRQLVTRVGKLRVAIREDSLGILRLKSKRKEVTAQSAELKTGISKLEGTTTKTREQRKLLKDLKQGHADIESKLIGMDQELNVIENNYKASVGLLASAQSMVKDLAKQLRELRKLLSPE